MAKEKKGGLEVEDPDDPGTPGPGDAAQPGAGEPEGLNADLLYGKPGDGAGAGDGKPGEAKPGEAKPGDAKPGEAKPGEAKAGEGGEPAGEQPAWDKERQERDQRHATERRELQGQIQAAAGANTALAEEIRALREGRETAASAEEDKELEAALAKVDELSDLSEPAQLVAAVKSLKRISLRKPRGGADTERVERIEKAVQSLAESVQGLGEAVATRQGRDDLEGAMAELDAEFGAEFHNDALEASGQYLLKQGRTPENPPTMAEKRIALRLAYVELAGKKASGVKPEPKPKPALPADAGTGGGLQAESLKPGTLESVAADMEKEGRLGAAQ